MLCPKQGNDLRGKHPDYTSNSGKSLVVTPSKGLWNYFGEDQKHKGGGDHLNWLMSYRKMTFKEALSYLSSRANIPLPSISEEERKYQEQIYHDRKEIYPILQAAAMFYHKQITEDHRRYIFDKWGLTSKTIDKYLIGYAPPEGHILFKTMQAKGFTRELLLKSGLFLGVKKEIPFDFFQGRIIFPYWNNHNIVYFIGRKADQTSNNEFETAKYKKLPVHSERHEFISPVISNEWFYGEDEIIGDKEILLTEGVTDCCSANQNNIPCISPVTVRFSKKDYPKILHLCQRAERTFICNDSEEGQSGVKGALDTAKFLDSKGIQVKIVTLPRPEGVDKIDVADYLRDHTGDDLKKLFSKALTYWEFKIGLLKVPDNDLEKIKLVKNFVETQLINCDELQAGALIKGTLKTKFKLDSRETKALIGQCDKARKALNKISKTELKEDKSNESAIIEKNGKLCRIKNIKEASIPLPITSFLINPKESITDPEEGETLRVELITAHKKFEVLLLPDCWNSVQKFIKALPSKETTFLGSGLIDVQLIRGFLSTKKMTHTKGVKTAGFHNRVFITEEGGLSSQGFRKDLIYFCKNQSERTNCKLISVESATDEDLMEIGKNIDSFNMPAVSFPLLGWTVACFFKPILMEITQKHLSNGGFPSASIQGPAGSGKTSTVQSILMRIWGIDMKPKSISELTRFTIMKRCNESNSIPLVLEENKSCLQKDYFNQMISALIRGTYNALEGERGKGDQTSIIYHYSAPIVIVGETGFSENALVDRLITVFLSRADSSPYLNNFLQLKKCPLDKLGRTILNKALKMDEQIIKETLLFNQLEKVDSKLTDRPRVNAAICRLGLCILGEILQKDFELFEVDKAVLEGITEDGSHERKSAVDKILEAMCLMTEHNEIDYKHQVVLRFGVDFETKNGILKLYTNRAYPTFRRWAKLYEFEGDLLPQETFKRQIKREPYFEEGSSIKIGGESKKGIKLNIDKMLSRGLEIYGLWAKSEKK